MTNSSYRPNNLSGEEDKGSVPYEMVAFPIAKPSRCEPPGHDKYRHNCLHGNLFLTLQVQTTLHVSTGVTLMGRDVGKNGIPLIKTMEQGEDKRLLIPGSSLKGCIRAIYETITNSRLGVKSKNVPTERFPASVLFGASGKDWGWQGLINISDARCNHDDFAVGYMPALWSPKPESRNYYKQDGKTIVGRKFYYHMIRALDKGEKQGNRIQQAIRNYTFSTKLHFKNLESNQLGALLIALGQDPKYSFALKLGAGKPVGMGTVIVQVNKAQVMQNYSDLRNYYKSLSIPDKQDLEGNDLREFLHQHIQNAHDTKLIEQPQLQQLSTILTLPTTRKPYEKY
jgi:CRISPR/Cas system CSM-associated protein Csm3 (group 7 of RAMP superfamily)